ncbi:hypothetical protein [Lentzea flava]|uniref:Uncharacterized protein n=1 Tax=Lentzea flava TaxID=103732 RepID=A0ABQ2VHW8_9PSEU|nr:hypothetical protein [Lentzea flava]MCP2205549.1 hypothetical protein [Lentzea flava]GGU87900.1 hypothetical protein GCM10010178_91960 [Lentzea flava]
MLVGWPQTSPDEFRGSVVNLEPPTEEDVAVALLPPGAEPPKALVDDARKLLEEKQELGYVGYEAAREAVETLRERIEPEVV